MPILKVKGFEEYSIDEYGNFYNKKGKPMIPQNNGFGYRKVSMFVNNKAIQRYIHRLLWETFVAEIPNGYQINHIDGNKSNNNLNNLELVTAKQNIKHAEKLGLRKRNIVTLKAPDLYKIFTMMKEGHTNSYIAKTFNRSIRCIQHLRVNFVKKDKKYIKIMAEKWRKSGAKA